MFSLTKAYQVKYPCREIWVEHLADQQECVKHFHGHPTEGAKQRIMQKGTCYLTNAFISYIGQCTGKNEEQAQKKYRHH